MLHRTTSGLVESTEAELQVKVEPGKIMWTVGENVLEAKAASIVCSAERFNGNTLEFTGMPSQYHKVIIFVREGSWLLGRSRPESWRLEQSVSSHRVSSLSANE